MQHVWRRTTPLTRTVAAVVVAGLVAAAHLVVRDPGRVGGRRPQPMTRTVAASLTTMQKSVERHRHADARRCSRTSASRSAARSPGCTSRSVRRSRPGRRSPRSTPCSSTPTCSRRKATLASAQARLRRRDDAADARRRRRRAGAGRRRAGRGWTPRRRAMDGATLVAPVAGLLTAVNLEVGRRGRAAPAARQRGGGRPTAQFTIVGTDALAGRRHGRRRRRRAHRGRRPGRDHARRRDEPVFGTVSEIGLLSTSDTGVAAYPVTVAVTGRPGGPARRGRRRRRDRLRAPHRRAHRAQPARSRTAATATTTVHAGGRRRRRRSTSRSTIGETSGNVTEITDGAGRGRRGRAGRSFTARHGRDRATSSRRRELPGGGSTRGRLPAAASTRPAAGRSGRWLS